MFSIVNFVFVFYLYKDKDALVETIFDKLVEVAGHLLI